MERASGRSHRRSGPLSPTEEVWINSGTRYCTYDRHPVKSRGCAACRLYSQGPQQGTGSTYDGLVNASFRPASYAAACHTLLHHDQIEQEAVRIGRFIVLNQAGDNIVVIQVALS